MSSEVFGDLNPPYATIVADPPWSYDDGFNGWGTRRPLPYSSMALDEIRSLPVQQLSEREGYLFLWTTNRYLGDAFEVLRSWGFSYVQTGTWCKDPTGKGLGGMFATTTEFFLVAQNIRPGTHAHGKRTRGQRLGTSWFVWPRQSHSQKPPAFFDLVEQVSPGPYVELFARAPRLGWDSWGWGYETDRSALGDQL